MTSVMKKILGLALLGLVACGPKPGTSDTGTTTTTTTTNGGCRDGCTYCQGGVCQDTKK